MLLVSELGLKGRSVSRGADSSGLRQADDYGRLLQDVRDGHIEPGQALLTALLCRARLDATGNVDPPPGGGKTSSAAREKLQRAAAWWLRSDACRKVAALLELPHQKICEMTEAIR